MLMDSRN